MKEIVAAFLTHDVRTIIETVGVVGVWFIVFAESGLLIGFFLPGDSLLFTAGFLTSPAVNFFDYWTLAIGAWIGAVVGDSVGYAFGKSVGPRLFRKEDSMFFKKDNLIKAQEFYNKHGGKAIVLARFMPIIRTFAPIVAGIGTMKYKRFLLFNFFGGTAWVFGMSAAGYFLGSLIPGVDKYLMPIILGIIILSILPPIIHLYKESQKTPWELFTDSVKRIRYFIRSFGSKSKI